MLKLNRVHHLAIICSNYEISKQFYTEILGFEILSEVYRAERDSYKLDLALKGLYQIELFSFPNSPKRLSYPESCGLRHIAFEVDNLTEVVYDLNNWGVETEMIRLDEFSKKRFTFFSDPDGLPIELYESNG